jgi:hypothetical protein
VPWHRRFPSEIVSLFVQASVGVAQNLAPKFHGHNCVRSGCIFAPAQRARNCTPPPHYTASSIWQLPSHTHIMMLCTSCNCMRNGNLHSSYTCTEPQQACTVNVGAVQHHVSTHNLSSLHPPAAAVSLQPLHPSSHPFTTASTRWQYFGVARTAEGIPSRHSSPLHAS